MAIPAARRNSTNSLTLKASCNPSVPFMILQYLMVITCTTQAKIPSPKLYTTHEVSKGQQDIWPLFHASSKRERWRFIAQYTSLLSDQNY
jgi:hypothetical protein